MERTANGLLFLLLLPLLPTRLMRNLKTSLTTTAAIVIVIRQDAEEEEDRNHHHHHRHLRRLLQTSTISILMIRSMARSGIGKICLAIGSYVHHRRGRHRRRHPIMVRRRMWTVKNHPVPYCMSLVVRLWVLHHISRTDTYSNG